MDAKEASGDSVKASKGLSQAAVRLLNSHVSLLSIELDEAKQFYRQCALYVAILVTFGGLFLILFSFGVVVYFWDTYRLESIVCLSLVYLLLMIVTGVSLWRLNKRTQLFVATKEELVKDKAFFYEQ